jgi:hypothetical protein
MARLAICNLVFQFDPGDVTRGENCERKNKGGKSPDTVTHAAFCALR